jgi:hypothetical protein
MERALAAELELPSSTLHTMLVAAELQSHRIRTFTFSPDPEFEAKLPDIVGLYLNRLRMPRSCAWMRNQAFRRWTARSLSCRSRRKASLRD